MAKLEISGTGNVVGVQIAQNYNQIRIASTQRKKDKDTDLWVDGITTWLSLWDFQKTQGIEKGDTVEFTGGFTSQIKDYVNKDGEKQIATNNDVSVKEIKVIRKKGQKFSNTTEITTKEDLWQN